MTGKKRFRNAVPACVLLKKLPERRFGAFPSQKKTLVVAAD
jgi:hypothetical protein